MRPLINTCGSWLASDRVASANIVVADSPPSLASQLPQFFQSARRYAVNRTPGLARSSTDSSNTSGRA
ncbi:hypothetical protein FCH79_02970 [Pseudomonas koreensis]|nr:hypothetical protein [Pseudomonas koreensis]